ncbi:MAG: c-type cytochrome [Acidobacteriaceae bacterium]
MFRSKRPVTALAFSIPAFSFAFLLCHAQTSPAPPVVTINTPSNNSAYSWNSLVNYSVTVTWNGKSTQYQEIPSNEVLITTTYVPDLSTTSQPASEPTPPGLLTIIRSGCIGCHEFRAKAMGPSFAAIAARFPDNPTSIATLSHYIREGSTGIFGPAAMPPHPAFTAQQLQAVAQWIVKSAANPNVNHYVGTEGTIRMQSPTPPTSNSGIALTAAYTASGQQSPHGESTVILHSK